MKNILKKSANYLIILINKSSFLSILFFHSNHPKRLNFYIRYLTKSFTNWGDISDELFYKYQHVATRTEDTTFIIYIGDSIIENLSRMRSGNNLKDRNSIAYWLGPITRMGFLNRKKYEDTIYEIKSTIKKLKLFRRCSSSIVIAWSSGSIDIRCSFYELIKTKTFVSEEDLFFHYSKCSEHLIDQFLLPLKNALGANDVILISEIDSSIQGSSPNQIKEIKKIRQFEEFPTLGSLLERQNWRVKTNLISKNLCEKLNVGFLEINNLINYESGIDQLDGVHLTNPETVEKINFACYDLINSRRLHAFSH